MRAQEDDVALRKGVGDGRFDGVVGGAAEDARAHTFVLSVWSGPGCVVLVSTISKAV